MNPFVYAYTENFIPWMVLTVLAVLVLMIFLGCIFSFVVAIWIFVTSWEDNTKRAKARASIRYMIMWLVFTIMFLFIFPFIFQKIWVQWHQYYSSKNVFIRAGEIIRWLTDPNVKLNHNSIIFENPLNVNNNIDDTMTPWNTSPILDTNL